MSLVAPGYLRPSQRQGLSAREEADIAAACPGLGVSRELARAGRTTAEPASGPLAMPGAPAEDPLWGPVLLLHRGHATDPELRHRGASGGALSALLVHLLETGLVTRVIQTAADRTRPLLNRTVVSRSRADIAAAAGSRYAPSAPLADLPAILAEPGPVAFVGKPCDVAALSAIAARNRAVARAIPIRLSFFCAGVPARAGAREILARLGVSEAELAAFRYRGHGWPGHATAETFDGREARMSYAQSWGGTLSRHVQHRCKLCADGTGHLADLVAADAWICDALGYPVFDERPGESWILARTARGAAILEAARQAGRVASVAVPLSAVAPSQPGQVKRKRELAARLAALALLGRPRPRYRGFQLAVCARQAGAWRLLRAFFGTARRALLPRSRGGERCPRS